MQSRCDPSANDPGGNTMKLFLRIAFGIGSCSVLVFVWMLCMIASWENKDKEMGKIMRQRRGSGS